MKTKSLLYKNNHSLEEWIHSQFFNKDKPCLVRIHAAKINVDEGVALAKIIKELLPEALIQGCLVSDVIYNGDIYKDEILISVDQPEMGQIKGQIISTRGLSPSEIVQAIVSLVSNFPTNLGILLFNYVEKNDQKITELLNNELPHINFVGGSSGRFLPSGEVEASCFDENGFYEHSISISFMSNEYILSYSNIITGHPTISDSFTITKTHDEYIDEIDGIDAIQWVNEILGIKDFTENSDWQHTVKTDILLRFPLVLEGFDSSSRFLKYDKEANKLMLYYTYLEVGQKFRIGYLSHINSSEQWQSVCQELQSISAESIFCYSCLFRKIFSNCLAEWELTAFKNAQICGAFLLGEIGTKKGIVQTLNGACSFYTIAEKEHYIKPDLTQFDNLEPLLEMNDDIIEQIHQVGNNAKINNKIFYSLIEHEQKIKKRVEFTEKVDVKTMTQFLKLQENLPCSQICLITSNFDGLKFENVPAKEVENIEKENRGKIITYIKESFPQYTVNVFRYDSLNFFFVIDGKITNSDFIDLLKNIYIHCSDYKIFDDTISISNNFTFTISGLTISELIDNTHKTDVSDMQKRFYLCEGDAIDENHLNDEFRMVTILNTIIKENAIIPYFQGIYDNNENSFFAYESLMRLQAPDGRLLYPSDFMQIAKKYDLYLSLSLCMVKKVFDLFCNRDEVISINISSLDIASQEFQDTIFACLKVAKNPQNYIFELLETERFENLDAVRSFIRRLKKFNCKIAIDDFGSGYANFIEFANFNVDFLKINGSLTKLLGTDSNYSDLLETITFMGNKMKVKLIAEFVETASTQKLLVESHVDYSQGYLFSKPMPFSELQVASMENKAKIEKKQALNSQGKKVFNQKRERTRTFILFWAGIIIGLFTVFALVFLTEFNNNEMKKINENFLIEIATGLSDKISLAVVESEISLRLINSVLSDKQSENLNYKDLKSIYNASSFTDVYLSIDKGPAQNAFGEELEIDIEDIYNESKGSDIRLLPIMEKGNTKERILIFSSNLYDSLGEKIGEVYGTYEAKDFSSLLSLKSFGGEAFYHLCQIDGEVFYQSGNSYNLFKTGNMYPFIDSLDITNGYTSNSVRSDLSLGSTILLNYEINKETRSAVLIGVPGTNLCIISIVLDEVNTEMIKNLNDWNRIVVSIILLVFAIYFMLTTKLLNNNKKDLLKALDSSRSLTDSLQKSIETDSLTSTYSRDTAIEKITEIISNNGDESMVHALVILDIDNFKFINDTYGHLTGDAYLQKFVSAIKMALHSGDILGRLGGDEFILLLDNIGSKYKARATLDQIFANVHNISMHDVSLETVSTSAGCILTADNRRTYEELVHSADMVLYEAKRSGKSKYIFYKY